MPHVCGDEPIADKNHSGYPSVCPTYVGMNQPDFVSLNCFCLYAPRMWG